MGCGCSGSGNALARSSSVVAAKPGMPSLSGKSSYYLKKFMGPSCVADNFQFVYIFEPWGGAPAHSWILFCGDPSTEISVPFSMEDPPVHPESLEPAIDVQTAESAIDVQTAESAIDAQSVSSAKA